VPVRRSISVVPPRERAVTVGVEWFRDVNHFARETSWAHDFFAAYALWGGLVVLALLLVAGWLLARRRPDAPRRVATAFLTGTATIVALVVNQQLISPSVARARPCHALHHVEVLLSCGHDYSFPSDHCVIAGAFAAGLLLLDWRLGCGAATLALLLGFARVYVGVHYPGDAAAGLLIGAAICLGLVVALRRPVTRLACALTLTPLRPMIAVSRNL
jgi:undecaprenyl-diphosphatase